MAPKHRHPRQESQVDPYRVAPSEYMVAEESSANLASIVQQVAGKTVVLSGCGGGADVFGCAWLFPTIRRVAKKVVLANLGFVSIDDLARHGAVPLTQHGAATCFRVEPLADPSVLGRTYHPEARMASRLRTPVYSFPGGSMTAKQIADCHRAILRDNGVTNPGRDAAIFLTDGGCDALLRGNEAGLATFVEDFLHIKAVQSVGYGVSFVCAVGTCIDNAHGVDLDDLHDRLNDLSSLGIMRVAEVIRPGRGGAGQNSQQLQQTAAQSADDEADERGRVFVDLVDNCDPIRTIVQSLTVAALRGHRGLYTPPHLAPRIGENRVPLSDRTATFFIFDMPKLCKDLGAPERGGFGYLDDFDVSCGAQGVIDAVDAFRQNWEERYRRRDEQQQQQQQQTDEAGGGAAAAGAAAASTAPATTKTAAASGKK